MVKGYFLFAMLCLLSFSTNAQSLRNGLVLNLTFNNSTKDESKFGNDGDIVGNTLYEEDRFGNACSAVALDGSNSFVSVPSSTSLNSPTNELTISAWIKPKRGKMNTYGLMWFTVCVKGNRATEAANSPHYRFQVTSKTVSINTAFTENVDVPILANVWYHTVMVYDGQNVKTYINDELIHNFPFSETLMPNNQPLEIGRDIPGNLEMHHGLIDDLRIYNRALSGREVSRLYSQPVQGTVGNCTNTVASATPSVPVSSSTTSVVRDTVVVYKTDTVQVEKTVYQTDTIEVDVIKTDTLYIYQRDTIEVFNTDTLTVYKTDTVEIDVIKTDTLYVYQRDTIEQIKEVTKYDTLIREVVKYDTIEVLRPDTVFIARNDIIRDTVRIRVPADTVRIIERDTVYVTREASRTDNIIVPDYSPFETSSVSVGDRLVLRYIEFIKGTSDLKPGYEPTIVKLINWMETYPGALIRLDGHTDNFGGNDKLLKLSLERADAVKRILTANGVDENRIKTKGFGGSDPRNDNSTNRKKAENRRVEVTILKLK